jgi:hypothetical protein
VLATSGSEPVAEPLELRLVDRRQKHHHRCLDDLVLQGSDAERPLSAIRLGNVSAAGWQRSVCACMNAGVEVHEVGLEVLRKAIPCQVIDAWSGTSREAEKPGSQDVDIDVVQERRELLLLVPGDSFS